MPAIVEANQAVDTPKTPLHKAYLIMSWPARATAEKVTQLTVSLFIDLFHTFWSEVMRDDLLLILQEILEEEVKPGIQQIVDHTVDNHTIYVELPLLLGAFHVRIPHRTPSDKAQFINRRAPPTVFHAEEESNVDAPPAQQQSRIIYYLTLPICGPLRVIYYLAKRVILSMVESYWIKSLRADIKQQLFKLWHGKLQLQLQTLLQDNIEKRKLDVNIPGGMHLYLSLVQK